MSDNRPTAAPRIVDNRLARRLEEIDTAGNAGYAQAALLLDPKTGADTQAAGDGVAVYAGPGSPINRVYGLGMSQPVREAEIAAAERFFGTRGEPTRIDLCPLADPSLMPLLAGRGYGVSGFKHVFWRSLEETDFGHSDLTRNQSVRVEQVTPETALLWAQVVSAAFVGSARLEDADVTLTRVTPHRNSGVCFLAYLDGTPVGGGALAYHQRTAICFSTSVRPAFRRMGVQSALLSERLTFAAGLGCDLAAVQTTPGSASQRNVHRFGFQLAYTKPTVTRAANAGDAT